MIDRKTIEGIARLARLHFPEEELDRYAQQLGGILEFAQKLESLDTQQVTASCHALESATPLREDVVSVSTAVTAILEQAPAREDHFFEVPKVLG